MATQNTNAARQSRSIQDRYHRVGLLHNPFAATPHGSDQAEAHFVDRGLASPPPPGSRTLVQVIGDQGAGKSTHVHHWQRATPGPYHYIPRSPYRDRWASPPIGPIVYADEIDRMPRLLCLRWFLRLIDANATLVAGTHRDLTRNASRIGFDVVTHHLPSADLATLAAIIDSRLDAAALRPGEPHFTFDATDVAAIHAKCGGNVRGMEIYSHELLAERVR